jgi:hypothetical protein
MTTVYFVQNDNGSQIEVTLTREDTGSVIDMTGATVVLKFKKANTSTILSQISAEVDSDFNLGKAVFVFSSDDLDIAPGSYTGEIQVTFSNGNIETVYEEITIVVREDY